jgi:site-specific DNA-methyltransferase (adenine-specific)
MNYDYIECGDNVALMKELPNECVDLTVTSPPYDGLRKYEGFSWDFESVVRQLFRITKQGGVVVWIVGDATINGSETGTSFKQALGIMEAGFKLHDTMIYRKDSSPYPETTRYYQRFEYMFIFCKGKIKTVNLIADVPNKHAGEKVTGTARQKDGHLETHTAIKIKTGRRVKEFSVRGNIWEYSIGKNKTTKDAYAYEHPAMFPEQLAEDHIKSWSNEDDLVFDPFLGSGTTAKMAVLNNRHYLGFELSEKYFDIACKRLDDVET